MDPSIILKLALAAALGGIVGLERQMRDKPAGLRTNMLICIGATQFMAISTRIAEGFGGDPTRIAAQIITGIGFLGAGAVIQSHGFVLGLTTAATIWVVAGIGMALGGGMYGTAVATTVLAVLTLRGLSLVERRIRGPKRLRYTVTVSNLDDGLSIVQDILRERNIPDVDLSFRKNQQDYRIWFEILASPSTNQEILSSLSRESVVIEVETGMGALAAATNENDLDLDND